jgi:hypothetical protein
MLFAIWPSALATCGYHIGCGFDGFFWILAEVGVGGLSHNLTIRFPGRGGELIKSGIE